jgi:hypothetical protein
LWLSKSSPDTLVQSAQSWTPKNVFGCASVAWMFSWPAVENTMDASRYLPFVGRLLIGLPFAMSGLDKLAAYGPTTAIAVERHISAEGVFVWRIAMPVGADMALTVFSASDTFDPRGPLQLQFVRGAHGMVDQAATSRSALWKLG